ncbi:hypothetical protein [Actinomadura chokoriensis]|uniref:Uncharacterized protein n=1 Tax=Actinomadura chokoriensis TaxID=454156 RepID=A0ABV4R452_9ACTN
MTRAEVLRDLVARGRQLDAVRLQAVAAERVYGAAVPLTTTQLIQAAAEADRLSGREDQGAWCPWVENLCPDEPTPGADLGR